MANQTSPVGLDELARAIDPGVRKHFNEELLQKKPEAMVEYFFNVETQEDYDQVESNNTGLGDVPVVTPGSTYTETGNIQAYTTTYTPVKYGNLYVIEDELLRYGKDKKIYDGAKMQASALARKIEKVGSSVFRYGFNTAYTSLSDGKPLFSVGHTRADGGTSQSNASSTGITLTEANLETGMLALEAVLNNVGELIDVYADCLIVPPALRKEALEYTKSERKAGSADNDINTYNGSVISFMGANIDSIKVWKYLGAAGGGSDTAWYLMSTGNHRLNWKWGLKPEFSKSEEDGFRNDSVTYKARFEASTGWGDWVGIWGSKGDGQAYAS